MLAIQVGRMTRRMRMKTPFRNGVPGKDWIAGFLKRHPDLSIRSPTALSTVRARMLNPLIACEYFKELEHIYVTEKPVKIWNIDETSVPLVHKPCRVLAETGAKNIPGRVGNQRENVSVLACVNAAGRDIPPFVIVKGKTHKSLYAYNTKEGVAGSVYTYQERAWMEDTLGELWFKNHFLKHCGPERPQLILLDSHSSHETLGLIDAARENGITLLAFPPHTTQWLCPLDKSVFGPLSREYSRVCSEFMAANPNNLVSKWEWPRLFSAAYKKAFSPENIASGFRKCGAYPLNANALPHSAMAPSIPFEICQPSTTVTSPPVQHVSSMPSSSTTVTSPPVQHVPSMLSSSTTVTSPPVQHVPSMPSFSTTVTSPPVQHVPSCSIVSDEEFIGSVLSGDVSFVVDDDGTLQVQLPVGETDDLAMGFSVSELLTETVADNSSTTMIETIDDIFSLPESKREKNPSKRKITCHRVLTSDDIVKQKREVKERKEREMREKEERKQARMAKKEKMKKKQS